MVEVGSMTQPVRGDALIVVDMQRDFLPGGALAVRGGDHIVPIVNGYVESFAAKELPIFFSRDWHPPGHCSFATQGGPWPVHCVAETPGAQFAPGLTVPTGARIVSKATQAHRDAYSAFQDTALEQTLRELKVQRVFVCGLATDYCVQATVDAALNAGFKVVVLADAVRAVDVHAHDGDHALQAMQAHGATLSQREATSRTE